MDYFPIFIRLAPEPVVVVGGGEVAARKIDLLLRARAKVTVVSPELIAVADRAGCCRGHRTHRRRVSSRSSDWCASRDRRHRQAISECWVAHHAERLNIPVNVVDDRELSRFIVPAIVDRSPVIVAVGSSGDAPVLTRRLRERLESFIPQRLGALAKLAGKLRPLVKTKSRIRARDAAFGKSSSTVRSLQMCWPASRPMPIRWNGDSIENLLTTVGKDTAGEVVLVGAGPGDPGLLTLRALRALQNADVVLYDRLVSAECWIWPVATPNASTWARRPAMRTFHKKTSTTAREACAAGQACLPVQGRRSFHFRSRRRRTGSAGRCRHPFRSRTRHHGSCRLRGLCRNPIDPSRSRPVAHVRDGSLQGRDGQGRLGSVARPGQTAVFYMGSGISKGSLPDCSHMAFRLIERLRSSSKAREFAARDHRNARGSCRNRERGWGRVARTLDRR